jgi:hypothetical protein
VSQRLPDCRVPENFSQVLDDSVGLLAIALQVRPWSEFRQRTASHAVRCEDTHTAAPFHHERICLHRLSRRHHPAREALHRLPPASS